MKKRSVNNVCEMHQCRLSNWITNACIVGFLKVVNNGEKIKSKSICDDIYITDDTLNVKPSFFVEKGLSKCSKFTESFFDYGLYTNPRYNQLVEKVYDLYTILTTNSTDKLSDEKSNLYVRANNLLQWVSFPSGTLKVIKDTDKVIDEEKSKKSKKICYKTEIVRCDNILSKQEVLMHKNAFMLIYHIISSNKLSAFNKSMDSSYPAHADTYADYYPSIVKAYKKHEKFGLVKSHSNDDGENISNKGLLLKNIIESGGFDELTEILASWVNIFNNIGEDSYYYIRSILADFFVTKYMQDFKTMQCNPQSSFLHCGVNVSAQSLFDSAYVSPLIASADGTGTLECYCKITGMKIKPTQARSYDTTTIFVGASNNQVKPEMFWNQISSANAVSDFGLLLQWFLVFGLNTKSTFMDNTVHNNAYFCNSASSVMDLYNMNVMSSTKRDVLNRASYKVNNSIAGFIKNIADSYYKKDELRACNVPVLMFSHTRDALVSIKTVHVTRDLLEFFMTDLPNKDKSVKIIDLICECRSHDTMSKSTGGDYVSFAYSILGKIFSNADLGNCADALIKLEMDKKKKVEEKKKYPSHILLRVFPYYMFFIKKEVHMNSADDVKRAAASWYGKGRDLRTAMIKGKKENQIDGLIYQMLSAIKSRNSDRLFALITKKLMAYSISLPYDLGDSDNIFVFTRSFIQGLLYTQKAEAESKN